MAEGPGGFFGFLDSPWAGAASGALGAGSDLWTLLQNIQARNQQRNIYNQLVNPQQLMEGFPGLSQAASAAALRDINSNYALTTGGAPGGAYRQAVADAMAKIEMDSLLRYLGVRSNALQGAQSSVPNQQPLGALGGIVKSLQILRQLGQGQGGGGGGMGIAPGFPMPGVATGYAGGSEGFRGEYTPLPTMAAPTPELPTFNLYGGVY